MAVRKTQTPQGLTDPHPGWTTPRGPRGCRILPGIPLLCTAAMLAVTVLRAADPLGLPVLEYVQAQQVPGTRSVSIRFRVDFSGPVRVVARAEVGVPGVAVAMPSLSGPGADGSSLPPGEYEWLWLASRDVPGVLSDTCVVSLAASAVGTDEPGSLTVALAEPLPDGSVPIRLGEGLPPLTDAARSTELVLAAFRPGCFTMGSPPSEVGAYANETPRRVFLSRGFFAGICEVTQAQWELVTGARPAGFSGDLRPVESVAWSSVRGGRWPEGDRQPDGAGFFGALRSATGAAFDLPTEARWEYACRAGTASALHSGQELTVPDGTTDEDPALSVLARYAANGGWDFGSNAADLAHAPVGSFSPNAAGLFDMHGNVAELCLDQVNEAAEVPGPAVDPIGPPAADGSVAFRRVRGGGWASRARACRSASRGAEFESRASDKVGFRVFLEAPHMAGSLFRLDTREAYDSDADGLSDSLELAMLDREPRDPGLSVADILPEGDFDGDGDTNADEIALGTDPADARSARQPYTDFDVTLMRVHGADGGELGAGLLVRCRSAVPLRPTGVGEAHPAGFATGAADPGFAVSGDGREATLLVLSGFGPGEFPTDPSAWACEWGFSIPPAVPSGPGAALRFRVLPGDFPAPTVFPDPPVVHTPVDRAADVPLLATFRSDAGVRMVVAETEPLRVVSAPAAEIADGEFTPATALRDSLRYVLLAGTADSSPGVVTCMGVTRVRFSTAGEVDLPQGWNLVSIPSGLPAASRTPSTAFPGLFAGTWRTYDETLRSYRAVEDPEVLEETRAYWVRQDEAQPVPFLGGEDIPVGVLSLVRGWNAVSVPGPADVTAEELLALPEVAAVWHWDASARIYVRTVGRLDHRRGYWVFAPAPVALELAP